MLCMQYDRSQTAPPSNTVELGYFDSILAWRDAANASASMAGKFATEVAVVGEPHARFTKALTPILCEPCTLGFTGLRALHVLMAIWTLGFCCVPHMSPSG